MNSIQSLIRTKVESGEFPAPEGTEAFAAYAIASGKGLIPEMESAARSTLYHPMTFKILGEGLRLFEDWALRDLADFRGRCWDNTVACLLLYLEVGPSAPSKIWVGCPEVTPNAPSSEECQQIRTLPKWLKHLLSRTLDDPELRKFTCPLTIRSSLWEGEYLSAFKSHANCNFCLRIQAISGLKYRLDLSEMLIQAMEKVHHSFNLFNCC